MIKLLIALQIFTSLYNANAASIITDGVVQGGNAIVQNKNFVKNAFCQKNVSGFTSPLAMAATPVVRDVDASDKLNGVSSCAITTSATDTAHALYFDVSTLDNDVIGTCEVTAMFKGNGTTWSFGVDNGSGTTLTSVPLTNESGWKKIGPINYPCGASIRPVFLSTGESLTLNVGNVTWGLATNSVQADGPTTIQKFTTGSGTYTTPAGVNRIRVRMAGGGGGGGEASGAQGATGGATTFGTSFLTANGGVGGQGSSMGGYASGGSATITAPAIGTAITGGGGRAGRVNAATYQAGENGGSNLFGGGGAGGIDGGGQAGLDNTGGGGAGGGCGGSVYNVAGGGGAGGYVDAIINSPSTTYAYAVGAAGAGGSGGAGADGKVGGTGVIIIDEYYTQQAVRMDSTNIPTTAFTPTTTGFGTTASNQCSYDRVDNKMNIDCLFQIGTATATTASVTLPLGVTIGTFTNYSIVGKWVINNGTANLAKQGAVLAKAGETSLKFSYDNYNIAFDPLSPINGNNIATNPIYISFFARGIPISGWTGTQNAPLIVGGVTSSSSGLELGNRAQISFAASPSILSQSGSWVSGVTRNSAGSFTVTVANGVFSSPPSCSCDAAIVVGDNTHTYRCMPNTTSWSSTSLLFYVKSQTDGNATWSFFDGATVFVNCFGPR
jgi:hypothetical protein